MPAKTERQARFMRMCAHDPGAAKGKCPSKEVAREFMHTSGEKKVGRPKDKRKVKFY